MSLRTPLFVTLLLLLFLQSNAQRNYDSYNRLGIAGGMTLFDINTDNLITEQGAGFAAGFTTRGSFRNAFDLIYGITYYNNKVGIAASNVLDSQSVDYTIQSAQVTFLGSYNIIRHHLSIEAGPILNVNGKLKLDDNRFDNYIIEGYSTLKAKDIQDVSKVNFHLAGGITAGLESFRLSAQYQYGVTNMLKNLNDKDLEFSDFEGNSSTITLAAYIYF